jgi:hypothetical protein
VEIKIQALQYPPLMKWPHMFVPDDPKSNPFADPYIKCVSETDIFDKNVSCPWSRRIRRVANSSVESKRLSLRFLNKVSRKYRFFYRFEDLYRSTNSISIHNR